MPDRNVVSSGATFASSGPVTYAGVVNTTRSARTAGDPCAPTWPAPPVASRQPAPSGARPITGAPQRSRWPRRSVSASTSRAMPPLGARNTGRSSPRSSASARSVAAPRIRLASRSRASARVAAATRSDSRSQSPAQIPPRSGATSRSSTSSPSRRRTSAPMASSPSRGASSGAVRSARARSTPAADRIPEAPTASRSVGTPSSCSGGSGLSTPSIHR
jgi:hypothetical protein